MTIDLLEDCGVLVESGSRRGSCHTTARSILLHVIVHFLNHCDSRGGVIVAVDVVVGVFGSVVDLLCLVEHRRLSLPRRVDGAAGLRAAEQGSVRRLASSKGWLILCGRRTRRLIGS